MSINNFKPQIWSARLLVAWRKSLVYGGPMVVNRDYEGEIAESGDVVKITSISDPTISDYVPNSTVITPEELTDAQRNLVIDQSKYWAFKVDDVDKRQAKGNVMPEAMSRAAYRLRDVADQYIAGLYTGVAAGNNLGTISVVAATPTDAYDDVLVPLKVTLDDGDVPTEGRYCVVPPWFTGRLLRDDRFISADKSGTTDALRNGFVGRAAGFNIVQSNNTPNPTGDDNVIQAGVNAAISFAEQINKTEAYRPESSFSDAVKGLALYGAKLVRPDGIAIVTASQT
ncbi:P22 phage major capsid protein family protein [Streptomyces caniscabiei]|uniref:phage capsid protein n=1 Tax=Streptomyces caniscabiei TaxID=2746961 RepID=UPI0029B7C21C|nr:phage capsid protein [Streptomyces caniscabiei]MDX3507360.1 P22 phage major capsid protein family protein [Streptomyces caniscabiei]